MNTPKNSLNYYKDLIQRMYVTERARSHPKMAALRNTIEQFPHYEVRDKDEIPPEHKNRYTLLIDVPKGEIFGRCPGSAGHICCNYLTVDLYVGCTLDCSYCIMKSYLNFEPLIVHINTQETITKIRKCAHHNPEITIRIGTGEVGDSLLFDPLFRLSEDYLQGVADLSNVFFELKTKTDFVDQLLDVPYKGNAVIAFSLNPSSIVRTEEAKTASLEQRLHAAEKAVKSGYNLAFHFDPVILFEHWEAEYAKVVKMLGHFPKEKIVWISLGTFRFTPSLKDSMEERPYLYDEFFPCNDGKYRYLQKQRKKAYSFLNDQIQSVFDKGSSPPVYMCMESETMWKEVFGDHPVKIPALRDIFRGVRWLP